MTLESQRSLSPVAKAAKTRADFLRKVELLEGLAASGVISGRFFPRTLRELAAWEDVEQGVHAWRKANIVSDPRYRDLRERYDEAVLRLLSNASKNGRTARAAKRLAAAEQEAIVLAQQLVAERLAHVETQKKLRLALAAACQVPVTERRTFLRILK